MIGGFTMFKNKVFMVIAFVAICIFVGCLSTPTPKGVLYTKCKGPVYGVSYSKDAKIGEASAVSILGVFASGDASVAAAARNGSITKIHHDDYEETCVILGIFISYKTIVYGE